MHGMLYNGHIETAHCEDRTCTPHKALTSSAVPGLCQLLYVPPLLASSRRNSQTALELEPKFVTFALVYFFTSIQQFFDWNMLGHYYYYLSAIFDFYEFAILLNLHD